MLVLLTIVWIASMAIGQYIGLKKGYAVTGFLAGLCLSFIGVILMAKIGPPGRVVREQRRREAADRQRETNRLLRQIAGQPARHGGPGGGRTAAAPHRHADRAGREDPDLAPLDRAVALTEARPPGDLGKVLTRLTINGRPQREPEVPGSLERRSRLYIECMRLLAGDRLAAEAAAGVPIGDGLGMEGLVAKIKPLFARERSLVRWVALRGAFTDTYINTVDPESRVVPFYPAVETVMGVGHVAAPGAADVIDVAPGWAARLTREQRSGAIQLFAAVQVRVFDYGRYSKMDMADVNRDRKCYLNDQMALEFIAWNAVAMLRLGIAEQVMTAPEPDALEGPGWYTDPLWGKAERYWDGADWTSRCRVTGGRELSSDLRPIPAGR